MRCNGSELIWFAVVKVIAYLDFREVDGYSHHWLPVYRTNEKGEKEVAVDNALTYIAHPDNPQFLGYASDEEIVRHICKSEGPSGTNRDYLVNLTNAVRKQGVQDTHLENLTSLLSPE